MFEDFHMDSKDKYYLLFLIIFSGILVIHYINFNVKVGVTCSDVYVYLLNALYFAGTNIRSEQSVYLAPFLCFLTSLVFRMGLVDKIAIFIVTGLIAIIGNIGLYLLFRRYFDEKLSLCGAIIYSTLTLYLAWLANGTLDIPAVAMTIWLVLFTIIAIDENPKYYIFAIPLFVLGYFTRYTIILMVPALLLYYVYKKGFKVEKTDLKYILLGALIGIIIGTIIYETVLIMGTGEYAPFDLMRGGISGSQGSSKDPAYNPDLGYYLINLPNFISNSHSIFSGNPILENPTPLAWAIFAILILGAVLWLKKTEIKINKKHAIPLAIFLIAILTYTHVSSVITTLIVLLGLYLLGKDSENKTGYFMLALILVNFIFYSYYSIKVNRYILPIFPAVIYFLLEAITIIQNKYEFNANIIPIALIILFAVQGFAFTETFEPTTQYNSTEQISDYLMEIEPNYQDMDIGVYNIRPFRWWLGENIWGIPTQFTNKIDKSNYTYYISNTKIDKLQNYTEIKNINEMYLYKKTT